MCSLAGVEQQCGLTDCLTRKTLLANAPPTEQPPRISFVSPLINPYLTEEGYVEVAAPCGAIPGVDVIPCLSVVPNFDLCGVDVLDPGTLFHLVLVVTLPCICL